MPQRTVVDSTGHVTVIETGPAGPAGPGSTPDPEALAEAIEEALDTAGLVTTGDARLSNARTPSDESVTAVKIAPSLRDPAANIAGARTLGYTGTKAAPGADAVQNLKSAIIVAQDGDLWFAATDRLTVPGAVRGGVLRDVRGVMVDWNYIQTVRPTDPAIGTAFGVKWVADINGGSGFGPEPQTTSFGPRATFNMEGAVRIISDQSSIAFAPIGFGQQLWVGNVPGQNRTITPGWGFMYAPFHYADSARVRLNNNDTAKGTAAFVDTGVWASTNGGEIDGVFHDYEIITVLAKPGLLGTNVIIPRSVALDVPNASLSGGAILNERIGLRFQHGIAAGDNIGILNGGAHVDVPVALTVAGASQSFDIARHASLVHVNNTSGANQTITAVPTIPDGRPGQRTRLLNVGAHAVSLQDNVALAGSNLAETVHLGLGEAVELMFNGNTGLWQKVGPTDTFTVTDTAGTVQVGTMPSGESGVVVTRTTGGAKATLGFLIGFPALTLDTVTLYQSGAGVLSFFGAGKITGSAAPTADSDLTTKSYVDGLAPSVTAISKTKYINYANAAAVPAPHALYEVAMIAGKLSVCTVAGSPGTWTVVGTQT